MGVNFVNVANTTSILGTTCSPLRTACTDIREEHRAHINP